MSKNKEIPEEAKNRGGMIEERTDDMALPARWPVPDDSTDLEKWGK